MTPGDANHDLRSTSFLAYALICVHVFKSKLLRSGIEKENRYHHVVLRAQIYHFEYHRKHSKRTIVLCLLYRFDDWCSLPYASFFVQGLARLLITPLYGTEINDVIRYIYENSVQLGGYVHMENKKESFNAGSEPIR